MKKLIAALRKMYSLEELQTLDDGADVMWRILTHQIRKGVSFEDMCYAVEIALQEELEDGVNYD